MLSFAIAGNRDAGCVASICVWFERKKRNVETSRTCVAVHETDLYSVTASGLLVATATCGYLHQVIFVVYASSKRHGGSVLLLTRRKYEKRLQEDF